MRDEIYSLYQDPMQSQPIEIPDTGIGFRIVPKYISPTDPIFLRHVLCLMITIRNFFHVFLCWRQLRTCNHYTKPPVKLQGLMSNEAFQTAKVAEMYNVEQSLTSYIFDTLFSCLELYFGVFPFLWKIVIRSYSIVDDLIWQSFAFVGLTTTYLVFRGLPQIFYTKLVLDPFYVINPESTLPLVGVLCTALLLIVLLQVVLIPLTTAVLLIEDMGGTYFVVFIWAFLFIVSIIALLVCNLHGIPLMGKRKKLADGPLKTTLTDILEEFKFSPDRVYIIETFHLTNANAYAWGCCKRRHVYIFDNLLWNQGKPASELSEDEIGRGLQDNQLVAFLAHELSHFHFNHTLKSFAMIHVSLLIYLILFGTCYHQSVLYEAAGFSPKFYPPIVGYWLVYKYVMPLYLTITNWIIFYFLRQFEYVADEHAHRLGYGDDLILALIKIVCDNGWFPYVSHSYLMWHSVRPSILQRLKYLNNMGKMRRMKSVALM